MKMEKLTEQTQRNKKEGNNKGQAVKYRITTFNGREG